MNENTSTGETNRRSFLSRAGLATAAFAAASIALPQVASAVSPALTFADIPGSGDIKVLNYALALEALETDLYIQALMRLTNGGTNALGRKIVGLNLNQNQPDVFYVRQFAKVEKQHRDFVDAALGSESLLRKAPFNTARFDFKMETLTRRQVVDLVLLAEKTGVGAYLGAIPSFQTRNFLQLAGAIQGTEARHTTVITIVSNILFQGSQPVAPLANQNNGIDAAIAPNTVLAAVSPFIVL